MLVAPSGPVTLLKQCLHTLCSCLITAAILLLFPSMLGNTSHSGF